MPPGETPWTLDATAKWGGGVENGIVRAVSVVPKPVQKPHPPIFQPFASSERSIRWCAQEGVTAILPPLHPSLEHQLCEVYAEVSGKPLGEGMGVLRDIVIADSDDEARAIWRESGYFCGHEWFEPFGFSKGLDDPKTGEPPICGATVSRSSARSTPSRARSSTCSSACRSDGSSRGCTTA